jgi:molybdopterin-guanine dinucleotide biosynthesis protein A
VDELTGLVLAGGRSRRMGTDKALLAVDGRPLLWRVAERLAEVCPRVVVAAGTRPLPPLPWDRVDDRVAGAGPLAGIIGGLGVTTTPLLAVAAVDMPGVSPAVFTELASRWDGRAPAVVPRRAGRLEPLHAVWATSALPDLTALFDAGERSPTRVLERLAATVVPIGGDGAWAVSVNTPADLARSAVAAPSSIDQRRAD